MTVLKIVFALTLILALQISTVHAAAEWRARSSVIDRDAYMSSDTEEEVIFGREIAARLLGQYSLSSDNRLQKYLNLVGTTLARNCTRPEIDFHFVLINSSEVNAYSTPGGYVFVTSALLAKIENEAELAGVLAHEIAHVTERHIVKELNLKGTELSSVSALTALIGGASESVKIAFSQAVDQAIDLILRDGYKSEDEMQADNLAVLLCAYSGYDPAGLITLLDKIGKVKTGVGKTYPVYELRLATINQVIVAEGLDGTHLALNTKRFATVTGGGVKENPKKTTPGGNP